MLNVVYWGPSLVIALVFNSVTSSKMRLVSKASMVARRHVGLHFQSISDLGLTVGDTTLDQEFQTLVLLLHCQIY